LRLCETELTDSSGYSHAGRTTTGSTILEGDSSLVIAGGDTAGQVELCNSSFAWVGATDDLPSMFAEDQNPPGLWQEVSCRRGAARCFPMNG
jgi:hypothetical protein